MNTSKSSSNVNVPLAGCVNDVIDNVSPSTSISFPNKSCGTNVLGVSSTAVIESSTASGASLTSVIVILTVM